MEFPGKLRIFKNHLIPFSCCFYSFLLKLYPTTLISKQEDTLVLCMLSKKLINKIAHLEMKMHVHWSAN